MNDRQLLEAALIGYQKKLQAMDEAVAEIRHRLGKSAANPVGQHRRKLSAAARKRISEATKKRWAEYRKKKAGHRAA